VASRAIRRRSICPAARRRAESPRPDPGNHPSQGALLPAALTVRPAVTEAAPLASQLWVVFIGWHFSVEQASPGRGSARLPLGPFRRGAFLTEMGEALLDHLRVRDADEDAERPAAAPTALDVDAE